MNPCVATAAAVPAVGRDTALFKAFLLAFMCLTGSNTTPYVVLVMKSTCSTIYTALTCLPSC